jgi:hydrogenase/urease accessory protein HupE
MRSGSQERSNTVKVAAAAMSVLLLSAPLAAAHDAGITSVVRVFIDEVQAGRYVVSIIDAGVPPLDDSRELFPSGCHELPKQHRVRATPRWVLECGRRLTIDDAITLPVPLAVVASARWADDSVASAYFAASGHNVRIRLAELRAAAGPRGRVALRYGRLGAEHVLTGADHLLFVFGLLLLCRGFAVLVKTVTAFTVGHSLTLVAAVAGLVPVNRGPVEAAIALSIVLLARQIVVAERGGSGLVQRAPWVVASTFGLFHGLGFAGSLGEIGLPGSDLPVALLFFNIGVEVGQLAFVGLVMAARGFGARAGWTVAPPLHRSIAYSLGVLATVWLWDRLPAVLGP